MYWEFDRLKLSIVSFRIFNGYASDMANDYNTARELCMEWNRQSGTLMMA